MTHVMTAIGDGQADELVVFTNHVMFNGENCELTSLSQIDTIDLSGGSSAGTLSIDLSGGPFAPGFTNEATGVSEIELVAEGWGTVAIVGDDDDQILLARTDGVNLTEDDDVDLSFAPAPPVLALIGSGGNDLLSAFGDLPTGDPYENRVILSGGGGDDDLRGGSAADLFDGGLGNDTFEGGGDSGSPTDPPTDVAVDTVTYEAADGAVSVDLAANTSSGAAGIDSFDSGIGQVIGSGYDDTLLGNASPQRLDGGPGSDILDGRGGTDFALFAASPSPLVADMEAGGASGYGTDTLDGIEGIMGSIHDDRVVAAGPISFYGIGGSDTIDLSASGGPLTFDLALQGPQATPLGSVTVVDVEGVIGSSSADVLRGSVLDDTLDGRAGNDRLVGRGGDDRLVGGPGRDTADYATAASRVIVLLSLGAAGGVGEDSLAGIESVRGSPFADRLVGDGGPNVLTGGLGGDTIRGLGGPDNLSGQGGNDVLAGGTGTDRCDGGPGADTLSSCERT